LSLVEQAITQPTIDVSIKRKDRKLTVNNIGIPQGLPISSILSDIYMQELDKKYNKKNSIKYYRFVDDILMICSKYNVTKLEKSINKDMKDIKLIIHKFGDNKDKSFSGKISDGFQYLGYLFDGINISAREMSIDKLYTNINRLFTRYKKSNDKDKLNTLYSKLNNKITGCYYNDTLYGWISYFSHINDMKLLFELDAHIENMCNKNDIKYARKVKKISRSYYEIKNIKNSYIPSYTSALYAKASAIINDLKNDVFSY